MLHLMIAKLYLILSIIFCSSLQARYEYKRPLRDQNLKREVLKEQEKKRKLKEFRARRYQYSYIDRDHSEKETLKHVGIMYAASWAVYPLSQPKVFREQGSWREYKKNFGQVVFDRDEPFWNWFVHPISGSQLYLYYRANGYDRINSLGLTFISSTLFEFTVEIYTEPASIQDIYQTPILGSILGVGLENLSLYLLNTGNVVGRFFGHVTNLSTLFPYFEGKVRIIPRTNFKSNGALYMVAEF
jgi:hypothetical protein